MKKIVVLAVFTLCGLLAVIYDGVVLQKVFAAEAKVKKTDYAHVNKTHLAVFRPTPREQIYDMPQFYKSIEGNMCLAVN